CRRAASAANHIRLIATELGMAKNALLRRAIQGCGLLEIALKVVFLNSGATGVADGRGRNWPSRSNCARVSEICLGLRHTRTKRDLLVVRAARQAHREHRAFARLARHRHIAAHHARELAREGKAEPRAAEALSGRG